MLGQLACGDYSVRVITRGAGAVLWEEIPFTSLAYSRVLDDTSDASVVIDGVDPGCAAKLLLAKVAPWQHELAIYRDTERVWVGPITKRSATGPKATISARDRSAWWDRRFIHAGYDVTADLATIFQQYFNDAMSVDPVVGFTLTVTPTGIIGTRSVDSLDHKLAGPEMREVSNIGIDWTCLDAVCLAGGRTIPTGRLPVITDDHLRDTPTVDSDGLQQVNHQVITGQQPQDAVTGQFVDGPAIFGEYADATRRTRDGLLEANTQDDQAADVASCAAGAQSSVALNGDEPIIVSQLNLASNAPLTIDQLVPGAIIDVELTFPAISVSAFYRISQVDVGVDTNGERVQLTVQPVGTT